MGILKVVYKIFLGFILFGLFIVILNSIYRFIRYRFSNKDESFRESFKNVRFIKYIDFVKWSLIDLFRGKDYLRLYGLWAFTGYYGEGKTLGCVLYANKLKNENPQRDIKIYSNIDVVGQERRIKDYTELIDLPPNSIFIYDESQSDFGSTNLGIRDFPPDLLRKLTQVRKNNLAIFATTPVYSRMNINMRESVHFVVESKNIFKLDRLFKYKFYHAAEYEASMNSLDGKGKSHLFSETFAVNDSDYALYNSLEDVGTIVEEDVVVKGKKNQYMINDRLDEFRNEMVKRVEDMIRNNNRNLKV